MRPTQAFGSLVGDFDSRRGRVVSYIMQILNIVFIGLYVIGTYEFTEPYRTEIALLELLLALLFLFEYVSRLDYADDTVTEAKSLYSVADILSIIPVFLLFISPIFGQLSFIRGIQALRVLRFVRILEGESFFGIEYNPRSKIVTQVFIIIIAVLFLHGGTFYAAEEAINPNIHNLGDSMYYTVVALSTTGFGDIVPLTLVGKSVTSVALILGLISVPWLAATARNTRVSDYECPRCDEQTPLKGTNYCHKCGKDLNAED